MKIAGTTKVLVGCVLLACLSIVMALTHAEDANGEDGKVRIGVFDTRSVALAYGRSDLHDADIEELGAEHKRAKDAGDKKRVAELEAQGKGLQEQMHRQVFSDGPIDDILDRIKDRFPELLEAAGVDAMVTRVVCQTPSVEVVDVTRVLVDVFDPDEKTLGIIEDLKNHPPVPVDKLPEH